MQLLIKWPTRSCVWPSKYPRGPTFWRLFVNLLPDELLPDVPLLGSVPAIGCLQPCQHCGRAFACDMYWCHLGAVCGDCRYYLRHGHAPRVLRDLAYDPNEEAPGAAERKYTGGFGSETLNRFSSYRIVAKRDMQIIDDWLADSIASLK